MKLKGIVILCYTAVAAAFVLPLFLQRLPETQTPAAAETPAMSMDTPQQAARREVCGSIEVLHSGAVEMIDMTEYLTGVVAAEMPASFEEEALKAQAVAARTYALYCAMAGKHGQAQVCTDSGCCQAWMSAQQERERFGGDYEYYHDRLRRAVEETAGVYLTYDGAPVLAVFHSSSAGATEESGQVWNSVPYLVSVSSPESADTVPGYISCVDVSALDLRDTVLSLYPQADFSGVPESWIGTVRRTPSGRTAAIEIGGAELKGTQLRQLFALRSTAFELTYTGEVFRFTVTGYGHGVGMSQYGANVMARCGADWREILMHYYPGAILTE